MINLRHGEPIVFGANGEYCVVKSGFGLEVAKTADVAVDEIVVHDAHADNPAYAFALSRLSDQNLITPCSASSETSPAHLRRRRPRSGPPAARSATPFDATALQSLLRGRDTWTVD